MRHESHRYLETVRDARRNTALIAAAAVTLALAVSVVAPAFVAATALGAPGALLLGGGLLIMGLACLFYWLKSLCTREWHLDGLLAVTPERQIEPIAGYALAQRLHRYLRGITAEDEVTRRSWHDTIFGRVVVDGHLEMKPPPYGSRKLIRQAIEYFVLDTLSLHLNRYFGPIQATDKSPLITVQREDVPTILRDNRFLALFSRPLEQRAGFDDCGRVTHQGTVLYAVGNDGAIYDHFELIVPRHSVVRRVSYCSLEIATPRFSLTMTPLMTGAHRLLPDEFEELYLGRRRGEIVAFGIDLELKIEFKWWSFLVLTGWDHYDWLDSYVDQLVNDCSFEAFLSAISWRHAVATATALHHLTHRPSTRDPD